MVKGSAGGKNQAQCRPVKECEFSQLKSLLNELGYDLNEQKIAENIDEIRRRGGEVFVAIIDQKLVGCVGAIIDVRLAAGINGEIVSLVVAAEYRGRGLGQALVKHAENWLGQFVDTIRVRGNVLRSEVHHFYEKLDYRLSKTQNIFSKSVQVSRR